eukprot:10570209-Alexandrium_andersonii.AAC.2
MTTTVEVAPRTVDSDADAGDDERVAPILQRKQACPDLGPGLDPKPTNTPIDLPQRSCAHAGSGYHLGHSHSSLAAPRQFWAPCAFLTLQS